MKTLSSIRGRKTVDYWMVSTSNIVYKDYVLNSILWRCNMYCLRWAFAIWMVWYKWCEINMPVCYLKPKHACHDSMNNLLSVWESVSWSKFTTTMPIRYTLKSLDHDNVSTQPKIFMTCEKFSLGVKIWCLLILSYVNL